MIGAIGSLQAVCYAVGLGLVIFWRSGDVPIGVTSGAALIALGTFIGLLIYVSQKDVSLHPGRPLTFWLMLVAVFVYPFARCGIEGSVPLVSGDSGLIGTAENCAIEATNALAVTAVAFALFLGVRALSAPACRWLFLGFTFLLIFQLVYGFYFDAVGLEPGIGGMQDRKVADIMGTFKNRNLFANFIVLVLPIVCAYLVSSSKAGFGLLKGAAILLIIVSTMAIAGTGSRAGFAAFLFMGLVSFFMFRSESEDGKRGSKTLYIALGFMVMLPGMLWFGLDQTLERSAELLDYTARDFRPATWAAMFDLHWLSWVFGYGVGRFTSAFALVHPGSEINPMKLHSDPMQFFASRGFLGASLMIGFMWAWGKSLWPASLSLMQKGALAGVLGCLLHSFVDYPFRMPGNFWVFAVVVGILLNPALQSGARRPRRARSKRLSPITPDAKRRQRSS